MRRHGREGPREATAASVMRPFSRGNVRLSGPDSGAPPTMTTPLGRSRRPRSSRISTPWEPARWATRTCRSSTANCGYMASLASGSPTHPSCRRSHRPPRRDGLRDRRAGGRDDPWVGPRYGRCLLV
jgi:hypothetical protein